MGRWPLAPTRIRRRWRGRRLALLAIGVVALGGLSVQATYSAFSGTTANSGSSFTAASQLCSGICTVAGGAGMGTPTNVAGFPAGLALLGTSALFVTDTYSVKKIDLVTNQETLYAGNGGPGSGGDGGPAAKAQLGSLPQGLAVDRYGNLFIADKNNNKIRKVDTSGTITTFAGTGTSGSGGDGGPATSAQLKGPSGVAVDSSGNVYIADSNNFKVRKVDTAGNISTVAGTGTLGSGGDGGPATAAQLGVPVGLALDAAGNLYIADSINNKIRKVNTSGTISTFAGTGTAGSAGDGGPATAAQIGRPWGVTVDGAGNVFITTNSTVSEVRKVNTSGTISRVAGDLVFSGCTGDGGAATSAHLSSPQGVAVDASGVVYIADNTCYKLRKVDTGGTITAFAGSGTLAGPSGDGGPARWARLGVQPQGVAVDGAGNIFIAEANENVVRKVNTSNVISTYAGTGTAGSAGDAGPATSAQLSAPTGVALDAAGNLYIADKVNNKVRKVTPGGTISTYAGTGTAGSAGDLGAATSAQLSGPTSVALDPSGNLYIGDTTNNKVRKVTSGGTISTYAGTGIAGALGDGAAAKSAQLQGPWGVRFAGGNLYIADKTNNKIRKVVDATGLISTFAGTGTEGSAGDGGAATAAQLKAPQDVAADSAGNVFIADQANNKVRKVTPGGTISTYAGTGVAGFSGDDVAPTSAAMAAPWALAVDSSDRLYITDSGFARIRRI